MSDSPVSTDGRVSALPRANRQALLPLFGVLAAVLLLGGLLICKDLTRLGIWDPHELSLADLGCRRAAESGKVSLETCGLTADSRVSPSELRPMLMVESVAFGFRLLGVSELGGRLPLALWALIGALALTAAIARLVDNRAALYAGAALLTMPMVVTQGRLLLGDAATMGAFALAFSGLAVAAFDRGNLAARTPWIVMGALGIAAGIGARGLAMGAAPALAVGAAYAVYHAHAEHKSNGRVGIAVLAVVALGIYVGVLLGEKEVGLSVLRAMTTRSLAGAAVVGAGVFVFLAPPSQRVAFGVMGACLALGAVGITAGLVAATQSEAGTFVAAAGGYVAPTRKFPTYDLLVRQIAHGAFPWSCFLPFAMGRLLARPAGLDRDAEAREVGLRVAALLAASLVFGVQTYLAPRFGLIPYAAPAALAVIVALVLRDLERAPSASLAIAIGCAVIAALVVNDFTFEDLAKTPVELATAPILEPYGIYSTAAPEELRVKLKIALAIAAAVFLLPTFFVWVDGDPKPGRTPVEVLRKPIDVVRKAWHHPWYGLLLLLLVSFEACILVAGLLTWRRALRSHIPMLQSLSVPGRDLVVNLWWYLLAAVVLAYLTFVGFMVGRDLFRGLRRQRVATVVAGALVAAGIWSFKVMPAVADQFTPKLVFAKYQQVGNSAPLGLIGVSPRSAAYDLPKVPVTSLTDTRTAYDWLSAGDAPRKFIALRAEHLAEMNRLHREKAKPRRNLPILEGKNSSVLLASNLLDGPSENPLDIMVVDNRPATNNPIACNLDGKLSCVGWDLLDDKGRPLDRVASGQRVKLRIMFEVTARISGAWQIFTHVEQIGTATARRTNDHVPLGGKYPMDSWLPGDFIVDESEFSLEPGMRADVPITILMGFFSGSTRLTLVSGPSLMPEAEGTRLLLGRVPVQ